MSLTREQKIAELTDDDLLIRLYKSNEAALDAAWRKHEEQEQKRKPVVPDVEHDDDLIPEDDRPTEWRDEDEAIERICENVGIIEAWERWSGKTTREEVNGRTEGILVSCPTDHPDNNPSCWVNTEKKVWKCGGCDAGGDIYDIAARHFGYPIPGYKQGKMFPDLRRDMAADLGYTFTKTRGGNVIVNEPVIEIDEEETVKVDPAPTGASVLDFDLRELPAPDLDPEPDIEPPPDLDDDDEDKITYLFGAPEPDPPDIDIDNLKESPLFIDWKDMGLDGTFLGDYMQGTCVDHVPDEYNFWMGLQCLGFASQMNVLGEDPMGLIKPGIFLVLYGSTGIGKTRSMGPMHDVLRAVMPWPDMENGVNRIGTPGSGEALVDATTRAEMVLGGTTPMEMQPKNIWLNSDEFGSLTAIANRKGSTLKTALMEFHDLTSGTTKDRVVITSRTHGTVEARDKNMQVTSSVQPNIIGKYAEDSDIMSGFLNRWVFAMGHMRRKPMPIPPYKEISAATDRLAEVRDWANVERRLRMNDAARDAWIEFYMESIAPAIERAGNVEGIADMNDGFMARIELLIKKLTVFFAINEHASEIEVHHVESATRLVNYVNATMIRLNSDFVWNFATEVEEAIIYYLKKKTKPVSMKSISSAMHKRFRRTDINRAMQTLIELDVVDEEVHKPKRGPTSTKYMLGIEAE